MKHLLSILLVVTLFYSCGDKEQKRYVSESYGNINNASRCCRQSALGE